MIHRYKLGGLNIVIDTCSCGVHAVDELAYELIGAYETTPREELVPALAERFSVSEEEVSECWERVRELEKQG
ncbi:MAG: thioether cross-link-forming SCIFF peptide maturase, partial [Clostridia bacterium]|nr:thioether cross-link-forming SCIFF peptide maturase [Clostridia bacterium]